MHFVTTAALLALLATAPHSAHPRSLAWTHVRGLSAAAWNLMTKAAEESATVRGLMDALETTDVVAYVEVPPDTWHDKPLASLTFVGASARQRFVLIRIDQWAATMPARAPALAHELQHALEVGRDPTVRDGVTLVRLYSRIGWQVGAGEFETAAARDAEQRARREQTAAGTVVGSKRP